MGVRAHINECNIMQLFIFHNRTQREKAWQGKSNSNSSSYPSITAERCCLVLLWPEGHESHVMTSEENWKLFRCKLVLSTTTHKLFFIFCLTLDRHNPAILFYTPFICVRHNNKSSSGKTGKNIFHSFFSFHFNENKFRAITRVWREREREENY